MTASAEAISFALVEDCPSASLLDTAHPPCVVQTLDLHLAHGIWQRSIISEDVLHLGTLCLPTSSPSPRDARASASGGETRGAVSSAVGALARATISSTTIQSYCRGTMPNSSPLSSTATDECLRRSPPSDDDECYRASWSSSCERDRAHATLVAARSWAAQQSPSIRVAQSCSVTVPGPVEPQSVAATPLQTNGRTLIVLSLFLGAGKQRTFGASETTLQTINQ